MSKCGVGGTAGVWWYFNEFAARAARFSFSSEFVGW